MDEIDIKMLTVLQKNGRIPISELSKILALSRPSVTERLHRLQDKNIIENFSAIVSPSAVGRDLLVMIELDGLRVPTSEIEEIIANEPRVIECHRATGHVHYYVKAALTGMDDLQQLIERLVPYCNTRTSILLGTPIENRIILPVVEE